MLRERDLRVRPSLDDKILTSWNALAVKAYVDASRSLNRADYLETAINQATFILKNVKHEDDRLSRSFKHGEQAKINGFLDDYAFTIEALIHLYQATFNFVWLQEAERLMEYALSHFYDSKTGMFFYTSDIDAPLIARSIEVMDNVLPSSNSVIAKNLFILGMYFEREYYLETAKSMLRKVQDMAKKGAEYYGNWDMLWAWFASEPNMVAIVGEQCVEMRQAFDEHFLPNVFYLGEIEPRETLPLLKNRFVSNQTLIYVWNLFEDEAVYTVTSLTKAIASAVEENLPKRIKLEGEISNYKHHTSGHIYFTLKDNEAQINAVIWRGVAQLLSISLQDGDKVLTEGYVSFFYQSGRYQIICTAISHVGLGALQREYNLLFEKLSRAGYFDERRKRALPKYAERIGIVTSETGAVLQDMLSIFKRRCPSMELLLYASQVQGSHASTDIVQGIKYFNAERSLSKRVDAIVIARGGGSIEDLWAFNTEIVANTVFHSAIPVVSAVGHEVDFSISDYVADIRAGTPSIAAELLAFNSTELKQDLLARVQFIKIATENRINNVKQYVNDIFMARAFSTPSRKIDLLLQKHSFIAEKIYVLTTNKISHYHSSFSELIKRINLLSFQSTLARGFALVSHKEKNVSKSKQISSGDTILIQFSDGKIQAIVE
ncbi:hypothetical protein CHS0354_024110 [Potamilus streckersoni]|uniref:Uncharacterized protein n=1 Tax=Potamilus streckersoni TaxID=2493646 RepID=A0AAE0VM12_9BIVA|nr:hypothetical protein CHS0354_024110 [Potamilus streckersoni]